MSGRCRCTPGTISFTWCSDLSCSSLDLLLAGSGDLNVSRLPEVEAWAVEQDHEDRAKVSARQMFDQVLASSMSHPVQLVNDFRLTRNLIDAANSSLASLFMIPSH